MRHLLVYAVAVSLGVLAIRPQVCSSQFAPLSAGERAAPSSQPAAASRPASGPSATSAPTPERLKELISDLSSNDGEKRVAATKAVFELGGQALEPLQQAGAKQISPSGTISTSRLDMVYSLLDGLKPNPPGRRSGYTRDSFGLRLEAGCTQDDAAKMGEKHGVTIQGRFTPDGVPNCYVKLKAGKALADVLKAVLTSEPKVVSVNLNYVES